MLGGRWRDPLQEHWQHKRTTLEAAVQQASPSPSLCGPRRDLPNPHSGRARTKAFGAAAGTAVAPADGRVRGLRPAARRGRDLRGVEGHRLAVLVGAVPRARRAEPPPLFCYRAPPPTHRAGHICGTCARRAVIVSDRGGGPPRFCRSPARTPPPRARAPAPEPTEPSPSVLDRRVVRPVGSSAKIPTDTLRSRHVQS